MPVLKDNFHRTFPYLRLSITDVCNFRCGYCLPQGYQGNPKDFLTLPEIKRLLIAFSDLGVQKVRLTGGEPTVRKDFTAIATVISKELPIKKLTFTTNGYQLAERAEEFLQAGLTSVNVSVNSLNAEKFFEITKHDKLEQVLIGIKKAQQVGFTTVKVNVVLLKDVNDQELDQFLQWIKTEPISIRFIELMQTGTNRDYFQKHYLSADVIRQQLINKGWQAKSRDIDAGPAIEYFHPEYQGRIGLIAPYSKDFCTSCNRLRISAKGNLHLCLFTDLSYPLRPFLQQDSQINELKTTIQNQLQLKKVSHFLQEGNTGINPYFASIGG